MASIVLVMPRTSLLTAAATLRDACDQLTFAPPTSLVYNPLRYAWANYAAYCLTYGKGRKRVVFLGMNPGPFGMVQTGIPFGEVAAVRDWMGLTETIAKPVEEHPKRPIIGLDCPRSEVSGRRLWGLFAERFDSAGQFFEEHFVLNYCPLAFLEAGGRNRTPDKLPAAERLTLETICDQHLRACLQVLKPDWLVGIGAFARQRAEQMGLSGLQIGTVLHPSPASPKANAGWAQAALIELRAQGIWLD
jgi:single-strand selective monofunctional uracil DNA glycosylase